MSQQKPTRSLPSRQKALIVTAIALAIVFLGQHAARSPSFAVEHSSGLSGIGFLLLVIFLPWLVLAIAGKGLDNVLGRRR